MILINQSKFNKNFQTSYNELIDSLQLHQICCPYCHHNELIKYGSYSRHILLDEERISLDVCRVKCNNCKKTHAILPSFLVPYQQVPLDAQIEIVEASVEGRCLIPVLESHPFIDESCAYFILKRFYSFWKELLIAASLKISSIKDHLHTCIDIYKLHFMQIRKIPILLFSPPT